MLRPFFSYYGGKWRAAIHYPRPQYSTIIEPFAGSAGYSLRYPDHDITLIEKSEVLYGIWSYLIHVTEAEILSLPDIPHGMKINDIHGICQEARWLMGFCVNNATSSPMQSPSKWARETPNSVRWWSAARRKRIASQLYAIRHWRILHGSYEQIEIGSPVTWFIDPPYQIQGKYYPCCDIDYNRLGQWCRTLPGQVIVCEGQDANWLPFEKFMNAKKATNRHHKNKTSPEMIWTNH